MTLVCSRPTPDRILELGLAFWGAKVLLSATELGLFTELAQGPADADLLRNRLGLHARGARDFLDALVALGLLERQDDRYSNSPEASLFLDRTKPSYMGGVLEMANARLYPFWGSLTEALRTGQPQNEAKNGGNFFAALYRDPAALRRFAQAMTGTSLGAVLALAERFPWKRYRTFVDVGTAQGGLPVHIARSHPHLTGIGFDLPPLQPIFDEYVQSFGLNDRLRFHSGDFFELPLPKADVVIMGQVLHDWNLEEKRFLIARAYDALPQDGALIIYDMIIDDERKHHAMGLLMSLNMLIETPGGYDYTGADCRAWLRDAGFRDAHIEHLNGPYRIVVGVK